MICGAVLEVEVDTEHFRRVTRMAASQFGLVVDAVEADTALHHATACLFSLAGNVCERITQRPDNVRAILVGWRPNLGRGDVTPDVLDRVVSGIR